MKKTEEYISIEGAYENNLRHISLLIPKKQITIFTGVSGSGKSSLVLDTIAARSTVGTYMDIHALLRLLFSRIGRPFVGYSDTFSFNHPQGKCPRCDGLGVVTELDVHKLVDFNKSLNEDGVINYVAFRPGEWRWIRYAHSGLFDLDKKIKDYSPSELELFLYSPRTRLKNPPANWPKTAKYEGLMPRMYRSCIHSEEGKLHRALLDPMTTHGICPEWGGTRLNAKVLLCCIGGKNIADISASAIPDIIGWLRQLIM